MLLKDLRLLRENSQLADNFLPLADFDNADLYGKTGQSGI